MKLLTKIFHSRNAFIDHPTTLNTPFRQAGDPPAPSAPLRFDIQIVHCLFSEFRQNIVPQICALVFLQGVIRMGWAHAEDFPLNLWDMERMYEGVYQYLEFFAILTDYESWKQLMAEWNVVSELVTLLRELEVAIPHGPFVSLPPVAAPPPLTQARRRLSPSDYKQRPPPPIPALPIPAENAAQPRGDVGRPFDITGSPELPRPPPIPPNPNINGRTHGSQNETNADWSRGPPSTHYPPAGQPMHDDPAGFEWRNLKKLCVLVLSSLVWKNRTLQDQVREFGGIEAILYCCNYDEHNPFIREHAIMCLRFLLEDNEENQKKVREISEHNAKRAAAGPPNPTGAASADAGPLERAEMQRRYQTEGAHAAAAARGKAGMSGLGEHKPPSVPSEVLDQHNYETFVDANTGKVGLRRKEGTLTTSIDYDRAVANEWLNYQKSAGAPGQYMNNMIEGRGRGMGASAATASGVLGMAQALSGSAGRRQDVTVSQQMEGPYGKYHIINDAAPMHASGWNAAAAQAASANTGHAAAPPPQNLTPAGYIPASVGARSNSPVVLPPSATHRPAAMAQSTNCLLYTSPSPRD